MKNTIKAIIASVIMTSCAHTDFYKDGKKIAHFEGDMTDVALHISKDGAVDFTGNINHSAATTAQGVSASNKIGAIGSAIGAAGIVTILK